jgi:hypothetical protein
MKTWGSGCIDQRFLGLGSSWSGLLYAPAALLPGKEPSLPFGYEDGWALQPVWTT